MSLYSRIRQIATRLMKPVGSTNPSRDLIDRDVELPWLQEQLRVYASQSRLRGVNYDNYTQETTEMRLAYRKCLAEPTVKSALLGKIYSVMALKIRCVPRDKTNLLEHEVAEFCQYLMENATGKTPGIIWAILSGGLLDGFSVCEPIHTRYNHGKYKGKIGLKRLKAKDTRLIQFEIDRFKNITAVINQVAGVTRLDPDDFVIFQHLQLFESPQGLSDLRASYRAVEMIVHILKLRAIFLDKYTGPFVHAKANDPALRTRLANELKAARAQGVLVTDEQTEIALLDLAMSGTADFQSGLDDLRKEVAIGISGAFLHMLTGGGAQHRGNSEVQQSTVDLFIWALSVQVEAVLENQLLPDYVRYNYGNAVSVPQCNLEAPNPEYVLQELKIDQALSDLGFPLKLSELAERTGRTPAITPEESVRGAIATPSKKFELLRTHQENNDI
ncbi:MAG: hypothetical protein N2112_02515 [Gemmataceae bacterium]|nr:hypothetical protein [Gemmataceae bacterium]